MTRFARTNHGKGHSYTLDQRRIPGVTTVIGILDKPALVEWAAKETAGYAMRNWAILSEVEPHERYEAMVKARWETNRKAIVAGHRIHEMGERLAHGADVEVPADLRGRVEAYARWLDEWDVEPLFTEAPVCNTQYRYGGTVDMVARFGRLDGMILAVDLKSGKRAYAETALQLVAYQNCDLRIESVPQPDGPRGGKRKPLQEERPMPPIDGALVAHIVSETEEDPARVDFLPVDTGADVWQSFLHVLTVYRLWHERVSDYKGDRFAPPIGEPIYPGSPNPFDIED